MPSALQPVPDVEGLPVGTYRSLKEADEVEYDKSMACFNKAATADKMADRALALFQLQFGCNIGNLVDMATHGLQTATRAHRDGASEETVVCALLHDIGEVMSPINHGEIAGSLLRPYISPENYWVLTHHEIFQATYYQDAGKLPHKDTRERFRGHAHFDACVQFCEKWDQASFDPDYDTLPLSFFEPMVRRIFARKPYWHSGHGEDPLNAAKMLIAGGYPMDDREDVQEDGQAAKRAKIA